MSNEAKPCKYCGKVAARQSDEDCPMNPDISKVEAARGANMETDHDVNALVSLATTHSDRWGDSCHHALAQEIVTQRQRILELGREVVRLRELLAKNSRIDVDRVREEGRSCEVLRTIVSEAKGARP
jgi:hypothetical protein